MSFIPLPDVGVVSTENSSTTPLGIGGVFTGTAIDTKDYVTANVVAYSDQASAANGLSMQWSPDGTNWDLPEAHTVLAATPSPHLSRCKERYFRVVYTNGAVAQTFFRLATLLKNTAVSLTFEPLSSTINDAHDAALVRSVLSAKKPGGDYTNVGATTGGNLKVSIEEQNGTANLANETGGNLDIIATNGIVSTNNSTTATLGGGAVFTGTADDILQYCQVSIILKTSHNSAASGLSLQWSPDSTNWDHIETYTVTGGTEKTIQAMSEGRYFRIVYTNGAVAQTYFRLQVIYKKTPCTSEILGLDETIDDSDDALVVRAILNAKNPGGVYGNINRTNGGNLKVSVEETVPPSSLLSGRKTIAATGTAEQLGSGALQVGVLVMALKTNTQNIFVGNSTVDKTSDKQTELEPGESYAFAVDNLSDIWVDVNVNGEGVSYAGS